MDGSPADSVLGDVDAALAAAAVTVDVTVLDARSSTTTRWSPTRRSRAGTATS